MLLHPDRLASDYPVRFMTFEYRSEGRGKGNYEWDRNPEVSGRKSILLSLRDKLAMCMADVEMELGAEVLPDLEPPASPTAVRSTLGVRHSFPSLRHRCRSGASVLNVQGPFKLVQN